jgi:hypothetical protein
MSALRQFEIDAITLLSGDVLSASQLAEVTNLEAVDSYEYTGSGYYLTLSHPSLPAEQETLSRPFVFGTSGDMRSGFVGFLGGGKFVLECHTWGEVDVPASFRDMNVVISVEEVSVISSGTEHS